MIMTVPFKPVFENESDASNERRLADFLERKYTVRLVRQKKFAQFDFMACKGDAIKAFVEMRCQSKPHDKYSTVMVTATKLIAAKHMIELINVPHYFCVEWSDGVIAMTDLRGFLQNNADIRILPNCENRRNSPDDLEPVAYIPFSKFKVLKEKQ